MATKRTLNIKVNGKVIDTIKTTRDIKAVVVCPVKGNEKKMDRFNEDNTCMAHARITGYIPLRNSLTKEKAEKAIKSIEKEYGWKNSFVTTEIEEA